MNRSDSPATRQSAASRGRQRAVTVVAALAAAMALPLLRGGAHAQAPAQPAAPAARGISADLEHPVLPIGSPLPDFNLPGVDGKTHKASEYAGTKALAIVFESNHCPVSQLYEGRIEKLYADYRNKGVTLVAINPNNPKTVRLDELGYTDVTDSLPEMKLRARFRGMLPPMQSPPAFLLPEAKEQARIRPNYPAFNCGIFQPTPR